MDKKGGVFFYGLMLGLTVIVLVLALSPAVQDFTGEAMNKTVGDTVGMDCANSTISNFDKAACTVVDLNLFYFGAALLLIGGALVTAKVIFF